MPPSTLLPAFDEEPIAMLDPNNFSEPIESDDE